MGRLTSSPWQVITTHGVEAAHAAMTNWSDEETDTRSMQQMTAISSSLPALML
jgi:hypothetical protein